MFALRGKDSPLLNNRFSKRSRQLVKNISFLKKARSDLILDKSKYKLVYHFPGVIPLSAILKTKVWVPQVGIALSPVFYFMHESIGTSILCLITACTYGLSGLLYSKVVKNTVGKIYVNKEDEKDLIISSMNSKGQRIDRTHTLQDIVNYDFPSKAHRRLGFINIGIVNSDIVYQVNVPQSRLIDPAICMFLFGKILQDNIIEQRKAAKKINLEIKKISST